VQLGAGNYVAFKEVNLAGIARVNCDISASPGHGGVLELRADSPSGPLVGRANVPVTGQWDFWKTIPIAVKDPGGIHDLYAIAASVPGNEKKRFNLDVLEFQQQNQTTANSHP
jgi:cytochrome c